MRDGSGLKYPAVKVHVLFSNPGDARRRRMEVIAGSSVEVSGLRSWVSCESG